MKKSILYLLASVAFNNPSWKLDANGNVEMKDGNPLYLASDGREMTIGVDTISRLNGEAKGHRERADAAETKLKEFEGLDAKKAKEALEVLGRLDQKKLIDAGEVEKVRTEISGQFTSQLAEKDNALKALQDKYDNTTVSGVFANSDFLRESIAVPRDMFESTFRKNFKVENGEVVAYGKDGNRLMSKTKHGEYATPEEALQILVDMHPQKEVILKAVTASGSGSGHGGGRQGGGRIVKRAEFEKMTPAQQSEISKKAATGEMNIVD